MGRLRMEPISSNDTAGQDYEILLSALLEAQKHAGAGDIYWDLDDGENPALLKKAFNFVARKEGLPIIVRRVRGANSLTFDVKYERPAVLAGGRMTRGEWRRRVLACLGKADRPLGKSEIIAQAGVSASTWNIRIKELTTDGIVVRAGDRRRTTYTLAQN